MADIKISQLGAAVAVADADVIPATANGVTVKVPASVLKEYAIGGTDISSIGDGTPTGAISALKSVKIEKTDIAPIETSVTSKAYAVGDQLYYNGMLYSVIAAIAQGETLVVDTNIELSDKVTEQIKALNGEVSTLNSALQNEVATTTANGAHNLLKLILAKGYTEVIGTTGTLLVNDDYSITISSDSAVTAVDYKIADYLYLPAGRYKISGVPSGASAQTYGLWYAVWKNDDSGYLTNGYFYDDIEITLPYKTRVTIYLEVTAGVTIGTKTFYPMIRLASDTDPTYQPYAMTNRELTDKSIKYVDVTDTTNANGRIEYRLSSGVPISAIVTSANYKYVVIATYDGVPKLFYIRDGNDNSVLANTQVTLRIYYIE